VTSSAASGFDSSRSTDSRRQTPSASPPSPLSRQPLGGRESPSVLWAGHDGGSGQARVAVASGGRNSLEVALGEQEQLRGSAPLESVSVGQRCAPPNPRLQRTRMRSPLSRQPLGGMGKVSLVAVVILVGLGSAVASQWMSTDPGNLTVWVLDAEGRGLPGAVVILRRAAGPDVARTVAGPKGDVLFPSVLIGDYEVRCELTGFDPDYTALVKIKPHRPSRVTLTMALLVGGGSPVLGERVPLEASPTRGPK
jgi:hypothetical protein